MSRIEAVSQTEAAKRLGISYSYFRELVLSGEVRMVNVPGIIRPRVPVSEIKRLFELANPELSEASK